MEQVTDWIALWRELIERHARGFTKGEGEEKEDFWKDKAGDFHELVKRRWSKPDSSRDLIISRLQSTPGADVLDIGAGTGAWTVLMARHARKVTAVEPSVSMIGFLKENIRAGELDNIEIIQGAWPEVEVPNHDYSICSHAMYGSADLPAFVRKMTAITRRTCFLLLRAPVAGALMARISERVWGHPYDSANFQVAYNVLLQMGIYANVLFEDTGLWDPWTNNSLDEAVQEVKRRFNLGEVSEHDDYLHRLLSSELIPDGDRYVWPRGVRTALVYWDTTG